MDLEKSLVFIETSFLSPLLVDQDITDISFNGENIYYLHNIYGRQKADIVADINIIKDFIRQIANLSDKQFSFQTPILDVSIGKYRINAVHQSIGRVGNHPSLTFSIRLASLSPRITDQSNFLTKELIVLFEVLLKSKVSIVIGGLTGSGKTEFQKYLVRKISSHSRLVIIDNILELEQVREQTDLDINTWQVDDKNEASSIQNLVKNALRSNPDWLIVAESRGSEMIEVLNSAMTGHPIITTIHATDAQSMTSRMARMVMMSDKKMDYENVLLDIIYHFRFLVYLEKNENIDGSIVRYIKSIFYQENDGQLRPLYKKKDDKHIYYKFPKSIFELLKFKDNDHLFVKTFVEADQNE